MVVRTIKTTYEESNRIADDKQTCIFRNEKEGYRVNDVFNIGGQHQSPRTMCL